MKLEGFNVPRLLRADNEWLALEMSIVKRPFVLDFAQATLDVRPDFSDDVWDDWHARCSETYGDDWKLVQRLLCSLESLGIYYLGVHRGNIAMALRDCPPAPTTTTLGLNAGTRLAETTHWKAKTAREAALGNSITRRSIYIRNRLFVTFFLNSINQPIHLIGELEPPFADAELLQIIALEQVFFGKIEMLPNEQQLSGLRLMQVLTVLQLPHGVASRVVHAFDFVGLHAGRLISINFRALAMMLRALEAKLAQLSPLDGYFKSFNHC